MIAEVSWDYHRGAREPVFQVLKSWFVIAMAGGLSYLHTAMVGCPSSPRAMAGGPSSPRTMAGL